MHLCNLNDEFERGKDGSNSSTKIQPLIDLTYLTYEKVY